MERAGDRPASADETQDGRAGNAKPSAYPPELVRALHGPVTEGPGSRVGRYKLIQKLGEGGFGIVFQAEQERPVRRTLALKIIKLGMDTPQVIARFDAERQALAMMDHPNIARVVDAGVTDTGRPYFVMELVKGIPITEYCDRHELSTDERLELFYAVCLAIQHAHQKGIIHRDLKPGNILVTMRDGKPVPKVIDFGIAKATSGRLTDMTLHTELNEMIGTPQYMSPEQAEMTALDIDTRSDIYSLGVLLYELLTGGTPLDGHTLRSAALVDMQKMIREAEPQRPSVKLATMGVTGVKIAIARRTDVIRLGKKLRGELDWIVLKAMEKDRTRRYDTAQGLALEIQRYLTDEPIQARPASAAYRTQKFVRKHKVAVLTVSIVAAALLLGIAGTSVAMVRAGRAREDAVLAEKIATEQKNQVVGLVTGLKAAEEKAQQAKGLAERSATLAIAAKRESDIGRARGRITEGNALGAAGDWASARAAFAAARTELKAAGLSPRAAEFGLWDSYRNLPPPLAVKSLGTRSIAGVEWLPDGRSAIALAHDGRVTIWDVPTGRTLRTFRDTGQGRSESMALSPDGATLLVVRDQKVIVIWDVARGVILKELPQKNPFLRVAFSRDGKRIITGISLFSTVLEFPSCKVMFDSEKLFRSTYRSTYSNTYSGTYRFLPVASPDPTQLIGNWYGGVDNWNIQTGTLVKQARGPTLEYDCAAISPDGAFIVLGDSTGTLRRWDFQSDRLLVFSSKQESGVKAIVFAGRDRILSIDSDGWTCEWDTTTRTRLRRIGKGPGNAIGNLSVHSSGKMVLATQADKTVALWALGASREATSFSVRPTGHDDPPTATAVLPDNSTAVVGTLTGLVCFWDMPTARYLSVENHREPKSGKSDPPILGLFPIGDDKLLCASGHPNIERLRLWDAKAYQPLPGTVDLKAKQQLKAVRLSKDRRYAIGLDLTGAMHAWDVLTLSERPATPDILGEAPADLAREMKSSDSDFTLSIPTPGISFQHNRHEMALRLEDPSTGEELLKLRHPASVTAAACSADERWLVTSDETRYATFWELGRLGDYESFAPRLEAARTALAANPKDAEALNTLGEWYAFRGENAWGKEYLEAAATAGAKISHLTLARCDWNLDSFGAAQREFDAALAANDAPADYLHRCLEVIRPPLFQKARAELTESINQKPRDHDLYAQRAKLNASYWRFLEAAADYDKALELHEDTTWRFVRGCLRLYAGDQKGYLEDCGKMVESPIHDPDSSHSNQACKVCLLQAGAVADYIAIDAEIEAHMKAEVKGKQNKWNKLSKAMSEYRLGHFDAVLPWVEKSTNSDLPGSGILTAELFEAMANYKAGRVTLARDQLVAVTRRMETALQRPGTGVLSGPENWLICQIARREAEALIR